MPALFAYLLSLAVFIGGGYVGLIWLTEPSAKIVSQPAATTAQLHRPKEQSTALRPSASDKTSIADLGSSPAIEPEIPRVRIIPGSDPSSHGTSEGEHKAVSGLYDHGDKDRQKSDETDPLNRDNAPPPNALAKTDEIGSLDGNAYETGYTGNISPKKPLSKPTQPASARNAALRKDPTTPSDHTSQARPQKETTLAARHGDRQDGSRRTVKQQSARSNLVMMTLRTIEFPDGHREQRLLPLRRSWAAND